MFGTARQVCPSRSVLFATTGDLPCASCSAALPHHLALLHSGGLTLWFCCWMQVLRGPLYKLLVGLENGEFTELLNAFVSRHALAVRSMGVGSE